MKRERITQVLERKIESRPDRDDLLEKNILIFFFKQKTAYEIS